MTASYAMSPDDVFGLLGPAVEEFYWKELEKIAARVPVGALADATQVLFRGKPVRLTGRGAPARRAQDMAFELSGGQTYDPGKVPIRAADTLQREAGKLPKSRAPRHAGQVRKNTKGQELFAKSAPPPVPPEIKGDPSLRVRPKVEGDPSLRVRPKVEGDPSLRVRPGLVGDPSLRRRARGTPPPLPAEDTPPPLPFSARMQDAARSVGLGGVARGLRGMGAGAATAAGKVVERVRGAADQAVGQARRKASDSVRSFIERTTKEAPSPASAAAPSRTAEDILGVNQDQTARESLRRAAAQRDAALAAKTPDNIRGGDAGADNARKWTNDPKRTTAPQDEVDGFAQDLVDGKLSGAEASQFYANNSKAVEAKLRSMNLDEDAATAARKVVDTLKPKSFFENLKAVPADVRKAVSRKAEDAAQKIKAEAGAKVDGLSDAGIRRALNALDPSILSEAGEGADDVVKAIRETFKAGGRTAANFAAGGAGAGVSAGRGYLQGSGGIRGALGRLRGKTPAAPTPSTPVAVEGKLPKNQPSAASAADGTTPNPKPDPKPEVEKNPGFFERVGQRANEAAQGLAGAAGAATKAVSDVTTAVEAGASGLSTEALSSLRQVRGKAARLAEIEDAQKNLRVAAGGMDPASAKGGFGRKLTKEQQASMASEMDTLDAERKSLLEEVKGLPGLPSGFAAKFQAQADGGTLRAFSDSLAGDDGVRVFGGSPVDPRVKSVVSGVVSKIIPDPKVSAEAADAASGLGQALAGIPPGYLAAAAGVTGVAGGAALAMPSAPAQPGY